MPERKVWSGEEDRILRLLIEERGLRGWTQIARTMEDEFHIVGRSGKQCRERYGRRDLGTTTTWTATSTLRSGVPLSSSCCFRCRTSWGTSGS
jgi:hypothetical protein